MANAAQFDTAFYLSTYPDVAVAISRGQFASAQEHYIQFGRFESRNPNAYFDTTYYLTQNADVAANRGNPFEHFVNFGSKEGRFSNATADAALDTNNNNRADEFDSAAYLAANQDVAANVGEGKAFATAYQHFILFGQFETRAGTPAGGPFTNTGTAANTGSTIVLTGGLDIVNGTTNTTVAQPATIFATQNNDTFVATSASLGNGDQINGLGGTDTLKITANADVDTSSDSITNVEVVEINDTGAFTAANLSGVAGLTTLNLNNVNAASTVSGLKSTVAVNATNLGGNLTLTYSDAGATGKQTAGVTVNGATTGTVSAAGIETLNLSSTGAASTLTGVTAAAATALNINAASATTLGNVATAADATVTVSGAGAVSFANVTTAIKAIDASANTGGVNVTAVVASDLTFTGGAGNDRIVLGSSLTTDDKIDGGAGNDTVAVTGADYSSATNVAALNAVTNFETVEFVNNAGTTTITGATFKNAAVTELLFNTAGNDVVNNAGARLYSFGSDNAGNATFNSSLGQTTLNLALKGAATEGGAAATVGTIAANGASTINIASSGSTTANNVISALNVATNSSIVITGAQDLDINSISNAVSIDGSAATGDLTIVGSGGSDIIVGGSGDDVLSGGTGTAVVPATPQTSSIAVGGTIEAGDIFTVTINSVNYSVTAAGTTPASVATQLVTAINNAGLAVTATDGSSGTFTLTGNSNGTAYTATATTTETGGATPTDGQTIAVTPGATGAPAGSATVNAADTLTGGAGNDTFKFVTGATISQIDTITDLNLGSKVVGGQVDVLHFDLATPGTGGGSVAPTVVTLTTAQQTDITNATSFSDALNLALVDAGTNANAVVQFTYGTDTYIAANGVAGGAGFNAAQDVVVKVTGLTGTLDASDIVIV